MQQLDPVILSWLCIKMFALGMRNLNKNGRFENDRSIIVNPCYDALAILRNADDLEGETFTRASQY